MEIKLKKSTFQKNLALFLAVLLLLSTFNMNAFAMRDWYFDDWGNITGGNITDGSVTGGNITGGNVTGGNITGGNITGGNITGGNVTGGNVFVSGDFTYLVHGDNSTCEIQKYHNDYATEVVIPAYLDGYKVTAITGTDSWDGAFEYCYNLTSLTIPESVTYIGDYAFAYCSSLTSVTIPENVTCIERYAFYGCSSLTSVTIPASVTYIGYSAFGECDDLTEILVNVKNTQYASENGVLFSKDKTTLLQYPAGKTGETYRIPEGVTSIGLFAFYSASSLTSITIPQSVIYINDGAFLYSTVLLVESDSVAERYAENRGYYYVVVTDKTELQIQKELERKLIERMFDFTVNPDGKTCTITRYKGEEANPTVPSSIIGYTVTHIGDSAFESCYSLTSVTIPNSVTSIGNRAFAWCESLTNVTIPNSMTSIGMDAFYDTAIYNNAANWENDVLYIGQHLIKANDTLTGAYEIKQGTVCIADRAFDYCRSLTSVTIPNSVTSIGDSAFCECSSLISVTIPNSVTSIEYGVFQSCSSLTSVTIPDTVTSIGDYAFCWCYSLTSVTIPQGATNIGDSAFAGCDCLTSVTIPEGVTSIGKRAFEYCPSLTSVTISNTVTSIGDFAFNNCSSLTSVTIPQSVTSIGDGTFSKSTVLLVESGSLAELYAKERSFYYVVTTGKTKQEIQEALEAKLIEAVFQYEKNPDGKTCTITKYTGEEVDLTVPSYLDGYTVTSIGDHAFWDCPLTSVTIPDTVTSIEAGAFSDCYSLTSVTIPDSVTSIEAWAFSDCESLISVIIPDGVTSIECYAFGWCSALTSVTIPNSVISIKDDAFIFCSSLTSVIIPENVISIGNGTFSNCTSLTSVTIPNSVTSIGDSAFCECSSLTSVTIPESVTSIGNGVFAHCSNLTEILVDVANAQYTSEDGVLFTKDKTELLGYPSAKLGNYAVPEGTKRIAPYAFDNVGILEGDPWGDGFVLRENTLEHLIFPRSLEFLADDAIDCCPSIQNYSFLSSTTNIDEHLVYDIDSQATVYSYPGSTAEFVFGEHFVPFETAQNPEGTTQVVDVLHKSMFPNTTVQSILNKTSDNCVEYSLSLQSGTIVYQPSGLVEVLLPKPTNMMPEFINVYRKNDNETYTDMHAQIVDENVEFLANGLGDFVLTTDFLDAKRGDFSEDGNLNLTDYTDLKNVVADFNNDTLSRREKYIADVDGDGVVDAFDLAELNKLLTQ